MGRARAILREKLTDREGNLREIAIWSVEPSPRQPEGIRYRLALIRRGEKQSAVLYDNHHPKGHHRHVEGAEQRYEFTSVARLIDDFVADIMRVTGRVE